MASSQPPVPPPVGPCKFGGIQTRIPFWGANFTQTLNGTLFGLFTAEADFDFVRLVYVNCATTSFTITAAAVAASGSYLAHPYNPTDATGGSNATLWTPVTFNNSGAAGSYPSPSGSVRTCTVPAATSSTATDVYPGIAYSDWIQASTIARTDGGTLPLLFTRTYVNGSINCYYGQALSTAPVGGGAFDAFTNGRIVRAAFLAGVDQATNPNVGDGGSQPANQIMPAGVQLMSRNRGLSITFYGDSLFQGLGTSLGNNNPFHTAAEALSTPSFPIITATTAYSGTVTANFQQNAYQFQAGLLPDVAFYKGASPNDGYWSTALLNASAAKAFAFCDYATRQGCVPVISTEAPWVAYASNPTYEAARQAYNAAIRASNWLVFDMDLALADPRNPTALLPAYVNTAAPSPPHYNDAGSHALATQQIIPILQKIMATRPR